MIDLSSEYSRRTTLKFLLGIPILPFTNIACSALLSDAKKPGIVPDQNLKLGANLKLNALRFVGMPAPDLSNPAAMACTSVASALEAEFSDGSRVNFPLSYQAFFITGDQVPDGRGGTTLAGGYYDINQQPIVDASHPEKRQFFSDCPDGLSLLRLDQAKVAGIQGNTVFAVVQFEYTSYDSAGVYTYAHLPSPIAVLTLDQDPTTGQLKLVQYRTVDTSSVHGLWITCGASLSPWNTHLSSEEYEPDATAIASNAEFKAFSRHLFGDETKANPYHYGHLPEVTVQPDGTGTIQKHYCMGRISHELVQVLPDERTVLMGDDATNGGLFMFIADRPRDLSSGSLYVAKWLQKTADNGGSADLKWIKLGSATSDEIQALADRLKPSDIVDARFVDPNDPSFTRIRYSGKDNWVKFSPGQEQAAAYLETHRYAAFKGGSLGFTKFEGTTVDAADKIAYIAVGYIITSMIDGTTDINVKGPQSGAVYRLPLGGGQSDTDGQAIASEWVPMSIEAVPELTGRDLPAPDALGNLADIDRLANPDNLKFSPKLRTLFIGEDSSMHVNSFLWAYNVDTHQLTRLLSCPAGAESTGLHAVDDVNGFTYIMSNCQHPGDWVLSKDADGKVIGGVHAQVYQHLDGLVRKNYKDRFGGAVGYLAGLPDSKHFG